MPTLPPDVATKTCSESLASRLTATLAKSTTGEPTGTKGVSNSTAAKELGVSSLLTSMKRSAVTGWRFWFASGKSPKKPFTWVWPCGTCFTWSSAPRRRAGQPFTIVPVFALIPGRSKPNP